MNIPFSKYHGAGNDFILIDNRRLQWNPEQKEVAFLCDRHFGIGADGLILLGEAPGYDFGMTYYNSDGNESTMCGNGGRCITAFAGSLGLITAHARFSAIDGAHLANIIFNSSSLFQVRLKMKDVEKIDRANEDLILNTGSPHYVIFTKDVDQMDVVKEGRKIRNSPPFVSHGINVDFVEVFDDHLYVRTYERGVENETLSCGTGVTAAAIAFALNRKEIDGLIKVTTLGGELNVSFSQNGGSFTNVWLEGPAERVFQGEMEIGE